MMSKENPMPRFDVAKLNVAIDRLLEILGKKPKVAA